MSVQLDRPWKTTLYQCQGCRCVSHNMRVIETHQKGRCVGAGIVRGQVWLRQVEDGDSSGPRTTINGHHTTMHNNIFNITTNITTNITINFPPNVVSARTDDEVDEAMQFLASNKDLLSEILEPENYNKIAALVYEHTKGPKGPPHLRNVRVDGRHVIEKRESGEVKATKLKFATQNSPRMLTFIQEAMEYVERDATPELRDKIRHARSFLFAQRETGRKRKQFSREEAVKLCAEDKAAFHAQVPAPYRQFAMDVNQAHAAALKPGE